MNENKRMGLSQPEVDQLLVAATGSPYDTPRDVARYLRYILGEKGLSTFLREATEEKLKDAHILITAQVLDGSLSLRDNEEGALLVGFCAHRVAKRLSELTGEEYRAFAVA